MKTWKCGCVAGLQTLLLLGGGGTAWGQVEPPSAGATIQRFPTGANVNPDGDTTVFITFGALEAKHAPGEALWCSEVGPAGAPEKGNKCKPATIFGRLPARFDRSRRQGAGIFTDIMAIPSSVARRALQAAIDGHVSNFFYVRQFLDTSGAGEHQYVTVTCNMTGSGASVPLALNDVRLTFAGHADELIYAARPNESPPPVQADIVYNGAGRLRGRWEVVLPGEAPPTEKDLLTEGSLTAAERLQQARYALIERFDVALPPTGKFSLKGPDPSLIPTAVNGLHALLLRVEVSNDSASDVNLGAAAAGTGIEHHGAVAAFPMPTLRYLVGAAGAGEESGALSVLGPASGRALPRNDVLALEWSAAARAALYRLVIRDAGDRVIMTALTKPQTTRYSVPSWVKDRAPDGVLFWQAAALDAEGRPLASTAWSSVRLAGRGATPPGRGSHPPGQ